VSHKWPKLLVIGAALASHAIGCAGSNQDTHRAQTRLELAKDLLAKGEDAAAESEAKKAIGYDASFAEAYDVLGLVFVTRAYSNTQLIDRDDCLEGGAGDTLRAEADEQMRQAEAQFEKATQVDPAYGEAWQNRAVVAMYFKDWDKAIEFEQKALQRLERLSSAQLARANLGWAHYQKQDYPRAMAELLQSIKGAGFFCLAHYRLAEVLYSRRDFEAAKERIDPLVGIPNAKQCPPIQEAQALGGQVSLRLKDREGALKAFNACVEAAPKSCKARECKKALAELTQSRDGT
jgi:Tfp pilus assembly protein PilF